MGSNSANKSPLLALAPRPTIDYLLIPYPQFGRLPGSGPPIICVTANLNVDYLRPAPLGPELSLRARVDTLHRQKAVVACTVYTPDENPCARGRVVAVRVPYEMVV